MGAINCFIATMIPLNHGNQQMLSLAVAPFALTVIASLAVFTNAKVMKWTSNPYLIPPPSMSASTQYLVFHGSLALNYTLSRVRCEALGGDLADVDSMETFNYLHSRLHSPAFIASFEGKSYGGLNSGLALYPGGAVAIPEGGPASRFPSICEVPLLGTYAIDLTRYGEPADKSVPVGTYGQKSAANGTATDDPTAALLQAGFVKASRRDPRFAGLSAQYDAVGARAPERAAVPVGKQATTTQSVVTVTIYGSIETDPALPCCRCCNQI